MPPAFKGCWSVKKAVLQHSQLSTLISYLFFGGNQYGQASWSLRVCYHRALSSSNLGLEDLGILVPAQLVMAYSLSLSGSHFSAS